MSNLIIMMKRNKPMSISKTILFLLEVLKSMQHYIIVKIPEQWLFPQFVNKLPRMIWKFFWVNLPKNLNVLIRMIKRKKESIIITASILLRKKLSITKIQITRTRDETKIKSFKKIGLRVKQFLEGWWFILFLICQKKTPADLVETLSLSMIGKKFSLKKISQLMLGQTIKKVTSNNNNISNTMIFQRKNRHAQ